MLFLKTVTELSFRHDVRSSCMRDMHITRGCALHVRLVHVRLAKGMARSFPLLSNSGGESAPLVQQRRVAHITSIYQMWKS